MKEDKSNMYLERLEKVPNIQTRYKFRCGDNEHHHVGNSHLTVFNNLLVASYYCEECKETYLLILDEDLQEQIIKFNDIPELDNAS